MHSQYLCEDGDKISINLDLPSNEIDNTIAKFTERLKEKKRVDITVTAENRDDDSLISSAKILHSILVKLKNYLGVTVLKIEKSTIDQECFQEISNLNNLSCLSLKESFFYKCDDYEPLRTLTELRKFDLSHTNIFQEDFVNLQLKGGLETKFMKFMMAIRTLTKLEDLNLGFNELMPQMMYNLKKKPKKPKKQTQEDDEDNEYNEYNDWVKAVVDLSVQYLVAGFKGEELNLSNCGLGPVFLHFYGTSLNQAGESPNNVDLTHNCFYSDEVASFIFGNENLPSNILFDKPEEIKKQLGSLLLQDKNIFIGY